MITFRRTLVLCFLWLLAGGHAASQEENEARQRIQQSPIFTEAENFISRIPGKSRVDVSVQIPFGFLVFVRSTAPNPPAQFVGKADIMIDLLDSLRTSAAHRAFKRNVFADNPPEPGAPPRFLSLLASFDVPPGRYTIAIEVDDDESMRKTTEREKSVEARDFGKPVPEISDILFLERPPSDSARDILPLELGGDVPFGRNFSGYVEIASSVPAESLRLTRALYRSSPDTRERSLLFRDTISLNRATHPVVVRRMEDEEHYFLGDTLALGQKSVWMSFRGDTLKEGSYDLDLELSGGAVHASATRVFHIRWFDMPRSLRSLPFAIDALEYIATKDELDEMKRAKGPKQRQLFEEFWKKRDKTSGTVFNEMMAEYYRRVDHSVTAFSTVHQQNGMKTDRGKTYILYGPPSKTERDLTAGREPTETWYYPTLHKKIVFVDRSRVGDYTLLAAEAY